MTKIEWTQRPGTKGETWNPIRARNKATGGIGHFCTKVSAGCQNCYAADFQKRFKNPVRYAAQDADQVKIFLDETVLMQPLRWKKPRTIFVCSMTDLFLAAHEWAWIWMIFDVMQKCPQHTFIVLTKRPEHTSVYFRSGFAKGRHGTIPLPNVWIGTSVEDQSTANERIPTLLETPAAVRFISAEPLLGPVELDNLIIADLPTGEWSFNCLDNEGLDIEDDEAFKGATIDWVICGGESGHKARPMHPDWARSLRDQCKAASVPFFFKQWGAWLPLGQSGFTRWTNKSKPDGKLKGLVDFNDGAGGPTTHSVMSTGYKELPAQSSYRTCATAKVGKKAAGRLLDGVEHNAFPLTPDESTALAHAALVKSGNYAA